MALFGLTLKAPDTDVKRPLHEIILTFVSLFIGAVSLSLEGPVFIFASEILPTKYKSVGQGLGVAAFNFGIGAISLLYPILLKSIGAYTFIIFTAISGISLVYVKIMVPETMNLSSLEITRKMSVRRMSRKESISKLGVIFQKAQTSK